MIPHHKAELTAIAFQLLAAIDAYEPGVKRLSHRWDPGLYSDLSERFDQMRIYVAALPQLSVPWVELLIARFELTEALWRQQADAGVETGPQLEGHLASLGRLRERCRRQLQKL